MAKEKEKTVETINFRGEEVALKFTLAAMISFEEKTGESFTASFSGDDISMTAISNLLHVGLLHAYPDLTLEEVSEEYDLTDISAISQALSSAVGKK